MGAAHPQSGGCAGLERVRVYPILSRQKSGATIRRIGRFCNSRLLILSCVGDWKANVQRFKIAISISASCGEELQALTGGQLHPSHRWGY